MATAVLKTFGALQEELDKAKENLKGVDEHIKRMIGRDPNDGTPRPGQKRPAPQNEEFRGKGRGFVVNRGRRESGDNNRGDTRADNRGDNRGDVVEPSPLGGRRRPGETRTVFSRLSGPPRPLKHADNHDEDEEDEDMRKPAVSSHVIATPRELPSRQEIMAVQGDERSKARNRRMFGALLGTLQKFRQEETRMKDREDKRAQVERKLEEAARKEKEELKKERQELFSERRRKQQEVRRIEIKMLRIKEQEEWESWHRPLMNFIQTKAKPPLFYLPKIHNTKTEERLVASQKVVAKMMEKKREQVREEMERLDARAAARAQRGQFEGDENGLNESLKDVSAVFDKENRLGPDGDEIENDDDVIACDSIMNLEVEVKREEHADPEFRSRGRERQRAVERNRNDRSDDEEELEYDELAKDDDEEEMESPNHADWPQDKRRVKEEKQVLSPKRPKLESSHGSVSVAKGEFSDDNVHSGKETSRDLEN